MSFTGSEAQALADILANTASGNRTDAQTRALVNMAAQERWRDIGSPDLTIDLTTVSTPPLVAGTTGYVLSSREIDNVLSVGYRLTSTSKWQWLDEILEDEIPGFDQLTGEPRYWTITWPAGVQTFVFLPAITSTFAVAGATLRLKVQAPLPDIAAIGDTIYLPRVELPTLAKLLASYFAQVDGEEQRAILNRGLADNDANMSAEDRVRMKLPAMNLNPRVRRKGGHKWNGPPRYSP